MKGFVGSSWWSDSLVNQQREVKSHRLARFLVLEMGMLILQPRQLGQALERHPVLQDRVLTSCTFETAIRQV